MSPSLVLRCYSVWLFSLTFHPKCYCYRSLQSMMNHISTVYSDYSITLAVIIFNLALIVAIDPHALSSWSLVQQRPKRISTAAVSPSVAGPKWIDLTLIHQFGSIGSEPDPLTHTAICWLTLEGVWALSFLLCCFCRLVCSACLWILEWCVSAVLWSLMGLA